jgi:hypothetical protein
VVAEYMHDRCLPEEPERDKRHVDFGFANFLVVPRVVFVEARAPVAKSLHRLCGSVV